MKAGLSSTCTAVKEKSFINSASSAWASRRCSAANSSCSGGSPCTESASGPMASATRWSSPGALSTSSTTVTGPAGRSRASMLSPHMPRATISPARRTSTWAYAPSPVMPQFTRSAPAGASMRSASRSSAARYASKIFASGQSREGGGGIGRGCAQAAAIRRAAYFIPPAPCARPAPLAGRKPRRCRGGGSCAPWK